MRAHRCPLRLPLAAQLRFAEHVEVVPVTDDQMMTAREVATIMRYSLAKAYRMMREMVRRWL